MTREKAAYTDEDRLLDSVAVKNENERLRGALSHYATQYCEGWCKENGGLFEDCGGCLARAALDNEQGADTKEVKA